MNNTVEVFPDCLCQYCPNCGDCDVCDGGFTREEALKIYNDAGENAFMRSIGMGTWLTAMPKRFPMRVQFGARWENKDA